MTSVHDTRRALRSRLADNEPVTGTFVKLGSCDVVELAAAAGLDFIVVDLEHSVLDERDAVALVRTADLCGLAALVRLPAVQPGLIARLLESGAAGIQLSTLRTVAESRQLRAACRFAPEGGRSISLANRVAGFGASALADFLDQEAAAPPLLVGQIETLVAEPLDEVLRGLDVAFVGTTDLSVSLGLPAADTLDRAVDSIREGAESAGVAFGGWAATPGAAAALAPADYVVVGSDLQLLATGLRSLAGPLAHANDNPGGT